jgi:hypothetical protein
MMHQITPNFPYSQPPQFGYHPIIDRYNQNSPTANNTTSSSSDGFESNLEKAANLSWKMSILKELREIKSILLAMSAQGRQLY